MDSFFSGTKDMNEIVRVRSKIVSTYDADLGIGLAEIFGEVQKRKPDRLCLI